jgi:hypothetical protein
MKKLEQTFRVARSKWGGNGSGSSSTKTRGFVDALAALLVEFEIKSVLDFGCGDLSWFAPHAHDLGYYLGVDVVPELEEGNAKRFPELQFATLTEDLVLPKCDLILCRDTLAHLSNETGLAMLTRMKQTGATYLLATNYRTMRNVSAKDGGFRPLNLEKIPFNFPEARRTIVEGFENKTLGLWRFADILPNVAVLPAPEAIINLPVPPPEDAPPAPLRAVPSAAAVAAAAMRLTSVIDGLTTLEPKEPKG